MEIRGVEFGCEAILFAMLEHGGKTLFMSRKDEGGKEYFELPWVLGTTRSDPITQIVQSYTMKTDITVQVGQIFIESEVEVEGKMIPCLIFRMEPLQDELSPFAGGGYMGFRWMTLDEAKSENLGSYMNWLLFL